MIDMDIFGDIDKSKLRLAKPMNGTPPKKYGEEEGIDIFGNAKKILKKEMSKNIVIKLM